MGLRFSCNAGETTPEFCIYSHPGREFEGAAGPGRQRPRSSEVQDGGRDCGQLRVSRLEEDEIRRTGQRLEAPVFFTASPHQL